MKLLPKNNFAVPHIGWNNVFYNSNCTDSHPCLSSDQIEVIEKRDFYFVHSFVAKVDSMEHEMLYFNHPDERQVAGLCKKCYRFSISSRKSGPSGYKLLDCFLR